MAFKLTYATMFDPPDELHSLYEASLKKMKKKLGQEYGMIINGKNYFTEKKFNSNNPADIDQVLGTFQTGNPVDADAAITAAKKAFPDWSRTPYQERVSKLRQVADLIDQRVYDLAAAISLEVGKNRMEALGDIAETSDLIRYYCNQVEENHGYVLEMKSDPLVGYKSENVSVMKPYGVWLVISPFNFPAALSGGPVGAALVTGNTVVLKPSTNTPWSVRLLAECFQDAGLPAGVFNFVTGPGNSLGQTLIDHQDVSGITFTGSYDVGMAIYRSSSLSNTIKPVILEMGGKNPVIVSKNADLDRAVLGITRSAFGLSGQKCSAASRIFIEEPIYDDLVNRLIESAQALKVGDPTVKDVYVGPVIHKSAYQDFINYAEELSEAGVILTGGKIVNGNNPNGYFCEPTIAADIPLSNKLWKQELFLPITMIQQIENLSEGMKLANDIDYGLTAGFYGSVEESEWFFDNIQAGVNYANRPQGATTGAWPGFQPFGGWKGSGSSGKNAGGQYYLPLYMHEQIHTRVY